MLSLMPKLDLCTSMSKNGIFETPVSSWRTSHSAVSLIDAASPFSPSKKVWKVSCPCGQMQMISSTNLHQKAGCSGRDERNSVS